MKVSVIIPVHNAAKYVAKASASALAQPETRELLLIDDGSSDDSLKECQQLAGMDARVRVLQHPGGQNRGAAASRNLGLAHAREEFIAFLDADDFYLAGRFEPARGIIEQDPSIDGVYDAVGLKFETSQAEAWWRANRADQDMTTVRRKIAPDRLFQALLSGESGYFCTDGIVLRKALVDRVGRFDDTLHMAEDTLLWLKCAAIGRLVGGSLDRPVAMRRVHGENSIIRKQDECTTWREVMYCRLWEWIRWTGVSREVKASAAESILRQRYASMHGRPALTRRLGALSLALRMTWEAKTATAATPLRDALWRLIARAFRPPRVLHGRPA